MDTKPKPSRVVDAKGILTGLGIKELLGYRYLAGLLVRREFLAVYKQSVLGLAWFVISPLLTSLVFTLVFGLVVQTPTDGLPFFLFYYSGLVCWNYFAIVMDKTARSFTENIAVFSKVYFPRLAVPVAAGVSYGVSFLIQFVVLALLMLASPLLGFSTGWHFTLLLAPLLALQSALLAMGVGMLIASATTKWKDLIFMLGFITQIWMYLSPVVYTADAVPQPFGTLLAINPMTAVIANFRSLVFGTGGFNWLLQGYSLAFTAGVLLLGLFVFRRAQRTFVDTI